MHGSGYGKPHHNIFRYAAFKKPVYHHTIFILHIHSIPIAQICAKRYTVDNMKHRQSRQEEALTLYKKGFSKNEIAEILGINRSTVTRYFYSPTAAEAEDFYNNYAYGAYITKSGEKIPFNRRYRVLYDKKHWAKQFVAQEWYYQDNTPWEHRFYNSIYKIVVYKKNSQTCSNCDASDTEAHQSRTDGSPVCKKCAEESHE